MHKIISLSCLSAAETQAKISVASVTPGYNPDIFNQLQMTMGKSQFKSFQRQLKGLIAVWKKKMPEGNRLIFLSDPWIAQPNLGGSLLLRTLFGMLKMSGLPVEWWSMDVADDEHGRSYHKMSYAIYEGMKGELNLSELVSKSDFQLQLSGYVDINKKLAGEFTKQAKLTSSDQIMMLDINVIGIAKELRDGFTHSGMMVENLRIGSEKTNASYAGTLDFLQNNSVLSAFDHVLHLHDSYCVDPQRDQSIGSFCDFTHPHNQPIPTTEAWLFIRQIAEKTVEVQTITEMENLSKDTVQPIRIGIAGTTAFPDPSTRIFYAVARIDRTKNFKTIIAGYAQAWLKNEHVRKTTSLVLLMPSPSELNNTVESAAIRDVVHEIFGAWSGLSDEIKANVFIYFVPPKLDGEMVNARFNECWQNVAPIQMNLSDSEGMPNAVFDAMSHSHVAMVADYGGMKEQVEHGVSGYHVTDWHNPPRLGDDFERLSAMSEKTLDKMGRLAYQRLITKFNPIHYAIQLVELLVQRDDSFDPKASTLVKDGVRLSKTWGNYGAQLITTLKIQERDNEAITAGMQLLTEARQQLADWFVSHPAIDERSQIMQIYAFLKSRHPTIFVREVLSIRDTLNRLIREQSPLGDCNNVSLVFSALAESVGLNVQLHGDIYHTFVSVRSENGQIIPIDFAYGDNILATDYQTIDGRLANQGKPRLIRDYQPADLFAVMTNRWAMDHIRDVALQKALYHQAIALSPIYAEPWNNLGDLSYFEKEYPKALSYYIEALQREPHNIFFKLNRILALSKVYQNLPETNILNEVDTVLQEFAECAEAHYLRFLITGEQDAYDQALRDGYFTRKPSFYGQQVKPKLDDLALTGQRMLPVFNPPLEVRQKLWFPNAFYQSPCLTQNAKNPEPFLAVHDIAKDVMPSIIDYLTEANLSVHEAKTLIWGYGSLLILPRLLNELGFPVYGVEYGGAGKPGDSKYEQLETLFKERQAQEGFPMIKEFRRFSHQNSEYLHQMNLSIAVNPDPSLWATDDGLQTQLHEWSKWLKPGGLLVLQIDGDFDQLAQMDKATGRYQHIANRLYQALKEDSRFTIEKIVSYSGANGPFPSFYKDYTGYGNAVLFIRYNP